MMTIRRATPGDLHTLARLNQLVQQLHVESQPERYKPFAADDPELLAFLASRLDADTNHAFIAEHGEEAVGYLVGLYREKPENVFVYGVREFHIDQMGVKPEFQRQGVGALLLEAALATAKELQAEMISLGVAAFNQQAIAFYEKHGFAIRFYQMWQPIVSETKE